uniref:Uncharacterized protein n=1 Tax=Sphaerodactylus townsendi TaxID=933632 RepID=A0ACB8FNJ7_9SAUR
MYFLHFPLHMKVVKWRKCDKKVGSFIHIWWTCKKMKKKLVKNSYTSTKILNLKFDLKMEMYLLNPVMLNIMLTAKNQHLFFLLIIGSKNASGLQIPTIEEWVHKV